MCYLECNTYQEWNVFFNLAYSGNDVAKHNLGGRGVEYVNNSFVEYYSDR